MTSAFDDMIELAKRLGISVRHAHLGGNGGGLAIVKGGRQLFVDLDADPAEQLELTARALARLPEIEAVFLTPAVRDLLEQYREDAR